MHALWAHVVDQVVKRPDFRVDLIGLRSSARVTEYPYTDSFVLYAHVVLSPGDAAVDHDVAVYVLRDEDDGREHRVAHARLAFPRTPRPARET